jgi:glutaredoxin
MDIAVYTKPGCGLCEAAKEKLNRLGLSFQTLPIAPFLEHHEGWRADGSCKVLAAYMLYNTLPLFQIDGEFMTYPQAMRRLKGR